MTLSGEQYPFVEMDPALGMASRMPYLPLTLTLGQQSIPVSGLLDTGATINVMPYSVGVQLGAIWDHQTISVQLSGYLAGIEARALVVTAIVGKFSSVRLAFAWARTDEIPIILGQVNFFMEFDVCFYRSRLVFEVKPK